MSQNKSGTAAVAVIIGVVVLVLLVAYIAFGAGKQDEGQFDQLEEGASTSQPAFDEPGVESDQPQNTAEPVEDLPLTAPEPSENPDQ